MPSSNFCYDAPRGGTPHMISATEWREDGVNPTGTPTPYNEVIIFTRRFQYLNEQVEIHP